MFRIALAFALLTIGPAAQAHGSAQGLGSFMGGFFHPLFEAAHLVALVALMLLVAQRGVQASTFTLLGLAAAAAAGLVAAAMGWPASTDVALLAVAAVMGVTVVVARPLPHVLEVMLAAGVGLGIGLGSEPEGLLGAGRYAGLAGTWLGTCLYVISGATVFDEFKRPWISVLIRVLGSWMVATSVLVLALQTHQRGLAVWTGSHSSPPSSKSSVRE